MPIPRMQFTTVDRRGDAIAAASVAVYVQSSGLLASIYSDDAGAVPKSNPFVSDGDGFAFFHANPDTYKVVVTAAGFTRTWEYVQLQIPPSVSALGTTLLGSASTSAARATLEIEDAIEDVASAAATDIGATTGMHVRITGTTTITSFGTGANKWRIVHFAAALTLTHDATALILPGGASITTAAGDCMICRSDGSGNWRVLSYAKASGFPMSGFYAPGDSAFNFSLTAEVAANALTIALKDAAGADPSSASPVIIRFRAATETDSKPVDRSVTAATSLVISSGSTLGTVNATACRVWIVAFDDAGTVRLGAINCAATEGIHQLAEHLLASSTAEGGAGAADSAGVIYTGTAVTSKPLRILGYVDFDNGQATAGTWATARDRTVLQRPGMPRPGEPVQRRYTATGAVATGTTTLPSDDTIPQNTEGNEYMSLAITPTSKQNRLVIDAKLFGYHTAASAISAALFQDSTANALVADQVGIGTATVGFITLHHELRADTVSATTLKVRAGAGAAGTFTFNGAAGTRRFGGVVNSFLAIEERMG